MTTAVLVLDNITIKTDSEGRFCLNDLHKASGGDQKHQPSFFFRLDSMAALINELLQSADLQTDPLKVVRGDCQRRNHALGIHPWR